MRKLNLIIYLIAFCAGTSAQSQYGIKGGMNLNYLEFSGDLITDHNCIARFGYSIGLAGEHSFNHRFYLQSGLNFISKNYALDITDFYGVEAQGYDRYNVLYLDLPVILGMNFGNIRLFGGGYFDYSLGGTNHHQIEYDPGMTKKSSTDDIDAAAKFSRKKVDEIFPLQAHHLLDAGFLVGLGRRNDDFSLDLTYSHGLINVFPEVENTDYRSCYKMYIRSITLSVFFYL